MPKVLREIKINNFRAYYDSTFNFKINPDKKLNVVFGTNDDGKTTFLNALRYTLYGEEEVSDSKNIEDKKEIKNINHLNKKTKVTLNLVDESTKKVTRIIRDDEELCVYVGQESKEEHKEINKLLPLAVKDLFIFEGEKSKKQITNSLKTTIEEVSGLKNLLIAKEILLKLDQKYLSEEKKLNYKNGEKQTVIESIQKLAEGIKQIKDEITLNNSKKEKHTKELREVRERLKQNNERVVSELQKRKESYEKQAEQLEERKKEKMINIKSLYVKNISNWMAYECIKEYEEMLKDLEEKQLVPTPFATKDIKKLKGEKFCICGNPIKKKEVVELNKIIEKNKKAPKNSGQLPTVMALVSLEKEDFKKLSDDLNKEFKILVTTETNLMKCQDEINSAEKSLNELKGEDVERDVAKQADLEDELRTLESGIEMDKQNLLKEESLKKINENKLSSYPTTSKAEEKIKEAKIKLSSYLEKLEKIYNKFMEKMKKEMLCKIQEVFKKIFSKTEKGTYFNFDLGENFELEVKTPEGVLMPISALGTGVKKSMGIATTLALSEIYGFEFPMILDAPFTELDRPQKKELLEVLIGISKKQQIIILILKEDLEDKEIFQILKKNSSTLCKISNMKNNNINVEEIK